MTPSTPVCCYCDTQLACEGCGREQPDTPSTPADPLAGLDERLDRLLLTARDNERFILSTESAKNIVGIVREWLRIHSSTPAPTDTGALADETLDQELERLVEEYHEGEGSEKDAAWNLIADFAVANSDKICAALRNSAPQEPTVDEIAARSPGVSKATVRNLLDAESAAPQETRGDELQSIIRRALAWQPTERGPSHHEISAELNEMLRATTLAASQPSPRLEREGVASEVRKAKVHVVEQWEGAYGYVENAESLKVADAILALLSPDTMVVSSTSRGEVKE